MTRSIRSYPEHLRMEVALRRLRGETKGLGYYAAKDYLAGAWRKAKKEKAFRSATAAISQVAAALNNISEIGEMVADQIAEAIHETFGLPHADEEEP